MTKGLKTFLDDVELMKLTVDGRSLIVARCNDIVSFHISGDPDNAVKHEAEYCSPNAVADICMNRLEFQLTSEQVVRISNFC